MRSVRTLVNAVLLATLVKPMVRRMVARWRRRAQGSAATTIGIPVQELLETALLEELAVSAADQQPSSAETTDELAGRGTIPTILVAGAVIAVAAGVALAIAALIRRRRQAREARTEASEWVAVPVDAPIEEAEEAEARA